MYICIIYNITSNVKKLSGNLLIFLDLIQMLEYICQIIKDHDLLSLMKITIAHIRANDVRHAINRT